MDSVESQSEYERIHQMNHQQYIMKINKKTHRSKWKESRVFFEEVLKTLGDREKNMKDALDTSITALLRIQVQEENVPLKKVKLDKMNGEPVWVVSYEHDGRWGIVDIRRESIIFLSSDGTDEEYWFDDNYIFRFKKEIKDYSDIIEKYGLQDNEQ